MQATFEQVAGISMSSIYDQCKPGILSMVFVSLRGQGFLFALIYVMNIMNIFLNTLISFLSLSLPFGNQTLIPSCERLTITALKI